MLSLKGITKRFPGVVALENVDLDLAKGEVLAVIGENGAGKSTLMKIIGGVYQAEAGTIQLDGETVSLRSPNDALDRGIRVIYQELSCLDNLTIANNVFLGREKKKGLLLDEAAMCAETTVILERLGLKLSPKTPISELSLAERQLVEIARALSLKVRILILDEPTSSLTLEECQSLFRLVAELKAEGVSILYISHRLDEVRHIADRVVGLRDGKNAGGLAKEEISHQAMVKLMVGRDIAPDPGNSTKPVGPVRLSLRGVRSQRFPAHPIDIEFHAGEILCMAGLVGAGRSELARAVFGVDSYQGDIVVDGKPVKVNTAADAIQAGVFLVPEDRRGAGLTVELGVRENISLPALERFAPYGLVRLAPERAYAKAGAEKMNVKTATLDTEVSTLSGGNQQKVVLARWLSLQPKVLIVDEPTRGIDVGAKAEIYEELRRIAADGVAIWMISSDMEEVLKVSDRIAVLHEGRLTGILNRAEASEEAIMSLAVGAGK